eukprot:CAMPEP_0114690008 /NCGR_PEP_ID=MMETSP0191-20121206/65196_1 /TAXON_ID=126664 /ORGANISM="Sorites sp." /LENGTH=87 /DNA_ID=CAMNT_0001979357 /DNA_START=471 /DNA_END=734 /DNA_ORIENTATION=+
MASERITAPTSVEIRSNESDSTCNLGAKPSVKIVGKAGPTKPWPTANAPKESVKSKISELPPVTICGMKGSNNVARPTNAIPGPQAI